LYYNRANLFQSWKEYDKALNDYNKAINYAEEQNDTSMEASIKNGLAGIEADQGNIEQAEKLYQEILATFVEENNIEEIVATYTNIALLYDARGMYQLAEKAHREALNLARTVEIPQLEISVLINLAEMFGTIANTHKAIELYNEALEILSMYDNDDLLSKCYLNLANLYEPLSEFDLAIKYAKLALELKEKLGQKKSLYVIYNALALSNDGLKNIQEAEKYYNKALTEAKNHDLTNYYGILVNYGLFLFNLKEDTNAAIECYDKAKTYFEKQQHSEILIAINSNYAMLYQAQADNQKAIIHYNKVLEYADRLLSFIEDEEIMMQYRVNFEHIYQNLIELYIDENNYSEAFYYLEGVKSRTFSKILSSKYFESNKIPIELLNQEKQLKEELEQLLNGDTNLVELNDNIQALHKKINKLYLKMKEFDDRYILIKENVPLDNMTVKAYL
jgi:tetratricopeptide (TPR) repeat protein